jgi:hypothetical protein
MTGNGEGAPMSGLTDRIRHSVGNPLRSADFDFTAALADVLGTVGFRATDAGGRVRLYGGADPVIPSPFHFASAAAVALALGIFDKAFATAAAGSTAEHSAIAPELFTAKTPLGLYLGMTDQIESSSPRQGFTTVLHPMGADQPEWLPRAPHPVDPRRVSQTSS